MKRWARLEIYEYLAKWSLVVYRKGPGFTDSVNTHSIYETKRKARLLQMFVDNPTCVVKTVGPEVWIEIDIIDEEECN